MTDHEIAIEIETVDRNDVALVVLCSCGKELHRGWLRIELGELVKITHEHLLENYPQRYITGMPS